MESILTEHDEEGKNTPMDFDTLFDTKALRIMRVLIPFFPAPYQPLLAVWLRFSQLQYALSLLKSRRFRSRMADTTGKSKSRAADEHMLTHLLSALKPCLSEAEYQELARMQNMFSMYQRFQQLMPYLSALSGMSGDLSAADMMNVFSAMQGGDTSASDMMNAFSAMQGGGTSAADMMGAFSTMQGGDASDTEAANDGNAADSSESEKFSRADAGDNPPEDQASSNAQSTGSGMDMSTIMDLISLFQASSDTADAEQNTSERPEE